MQIAAHTLLYSDDPEATRAFLRDVLGWPFVAEERDPSWLIFRTGPSELGVHPTRGEGGEQWAATGTHEFCLVVDDITATVAQWSERGAEFDGDPEDMGFGIGVRMQVPGAATMLVYEARHEIAYDL